VWWDTPTVPKPLPLFKHLKSFLVNLWSCGQYLIVVQPFPHKKSGCGEKNAAILITPVDSAIHGTKRRFSCTSCSITTIGMSSNFGPMVWKVDQRRIWLQSFHDTQSLPTGSLALRRGCCTTIFCTQSVSQVSGSVYGQPRVHSIVVARSLLPRSACSHHNHYGKPRTAKGQNSEAGNTFLAFKTPSTIISVQSDLATSFGLCSQRRDAQGPIVWHSPAAPHHVTVVTTISMTQFKSLGVFEVGLSVFYLSFVSRLVFSTVYEYIIEQVGPVNKWLGRIIQGFSIML